MREPPGECCGIFHSCHTAPVPTKNRLVSNPFANRLVTNPLVFHLLFTSFVKNRFSSQTRLLGDDDWLFFNYGYEEDPPLAVPLAASDEPYRYFIQLYHRTAAQVDLSGKRVLEASCGHGGGASYLMRTLHPASYTGLDLNPAGIEFCKKRHNLVGLDFVEGDAEDLPFADQSFDAVLNVEASHLYPHFSRFLVEVARVMSPGAHFLYADFRRRRDIPEWEAALADAPLRLLSHASIDAAVLRGNVKNSPWKHKLISRHGSAIPRSFARYASDMTDWAFNGALQRGEFAYRVYCFVKD